MKNERVTETTHDLNSPIEASAGWVGNAGKGVKHGGRRGKAGG